MRSTPGGSRHPTHDRSIEMSNPRTTITETLMTSDTTHHWAARDTFEYGWWWVTWMPQHQFCDRNQAITAMIIAEFAVLGVEPGHRLWPHMVNFAAELGMSGEQALALAKTPLEPADDGAYINPSGMVQNL